MNQIARQNQCVNCLGYQEQVHVVGFSMGVHPCIICGQHATPMTHAQWMEALKARRTQWVKENGVTVRAWRKLL